MRAMAMRRLTLFAACIVAIWCCDANAASPAPSVDCSSVLYEMLPCVDYITFGSRKTKPAKECCSGVKVALETDGECVCEALRESGSMGIQVNLTKAIALPAACGISTPLPECGIPLPPGTAPTPGVPSPTPSVPSPGVPSPTPAPGVPSPGVPTPAPSPVYPPPDAAPSPTPVNPPPPPPPELAPTPGGGAGEESPAPSPSDAATFTISSNLSVALLLTLLASFIY